MTREERTTKLKAYITCLKCRIKGHSCDDNCPTQYEAGNMGEIIENLEWIAEIFKQEPCEDAVSREYLLGDSKYHTVFNDDTGVFEDVVYREDIKKAPPVNPKPKIGHWIMTSDYLTTAYASRDYVKCSCCGEDSLEEGNYCPNCGAKMVDPQESEEN